MPDTWWGSGVYCLRVKNELYVGKAKCVRQRLVGHSIRWDEANLLEYWDDPDWVTIQELALAERFWLFQLKPTLNTVLPLGYFPLTEEEKKVRAKAQYDKRKAIGRAKKAAARAASENQ